MSFFERLKNAASPEWRAYTEHPFTDAMADGSLDEPAFRHYLAQDYLFLIEFARAYALAIYKSPDLAEMRAAAAGLSAILDVEMELHVKLCAGWGLSPNELEQAPPQMAGDEHVLEIRPVVLEPELHEQPVSVVVEAQTAAVASAPLAVERAQVAGLERTTLPIRHEKSHIGVAPALV